jgi:cobaltochelatase CobN
VETVRKGYWKADQATQKKLVEEYLASVNRHGVGCAEFTCGNPRLSQYVMERARTMGVPAPVIEGFRKAMEQATGKHIGQAAQAMEKFVERNEAPRQVSQAAPRPAPGSAPQLQGYLMEVREQARAAARQAGPAASREWASLWVSAPVLGFLVVWRMRRRVAERRLR